MDVRVARERLERGEPLFGVFCKSTAPELIEILGHAGFDFCILDQEHGPASLETLQHLIRAAELAQILPIVRTRDAQAEGAAQPLDLGAAGVQVPQMSSAADARAMIEALKFAPLGQRGLCRFVRAANFSALERDIYFAQANQSLVILQLEGTAIEEYRLIADTPGVDVLFIGPYDLSQALGIPGQIEDPRVLAKAREIIAIAREKGKATGIFADTPGQAQRWLEAGVQYIAYSVDMGIFYNACREIATTLRGLAASRGGA